MIYFTADTHFHHENIIKHTNRRFKDVNKMNEVLISNWNKLVSSEDVVYILGDVSMKGGLLVSEVLGQLKGKKYLITGNHDNFHKDSQFSDYLLNEIYQYHELEYKSTLFVLFHYPITEWNGYHKGAIHLHGHIHSSPEYNIENREKGLKKFDVGVDANEMKPVSIEEILTFLVDFSGKKLIASKWKFLETLPEIHFITSPCSLKKEGYPVPSNHQKAK